MICTDLKMSSLIKWMLSIPLLVAHTLWDRFNSLLRITSEQINMYYAGIWNLFWNLDMLKNIRIEIQPTVPSFSLDTAGIVALAIHAVDLRSRPTTSAGGTLGPGLSLWRILPPYRNRLLLRSSTVLSYVLDFTYSNELLISIMVNTQHAVP